MKHLKNLRNGRQKGQSLIIVALAIFVLIGLVGLAVDLGLAFVERIRVRRAADASALAAASELPFEQGAVIRALEFLEENDYGCGLTVDASGVYQCTNLGDTRIEVNTGAVDEVAMGAAEEDAVRIIRINTNDFRDFTRTDPYNSADRIRVEIVENVNVFFMRVFGFFDVPVAGIAIAENINQLDIALVYDKSGSMEYDTLCYGCWAPNSSKEYPDGDLYPLPWDGDLNGVADHCEGNSPVTYDGRTYIVIEAEEYSAISNPYQRELYTQGLTFWSLGRNGGQPRTSYMGNAGALGRDVYGAYISHLPYMSYDSQQGTGVHCTWDDLMNGQMCRRSAQVTAWNGPYPNPRVDYGFTVPNTGVWYVWIRGQGGEGNKHIMWGFDGAPIGQGYVNHTSPQYHGADRWNWDLRRLGCGESNNQPCGQTLSSSADYTLNIWAGAVSFDIDRIIITTDNRDPAYFFEDSDGDGNYYDQNDRYPRSQYEDLVNTVLKGNNVDNNRTGGACDPCDARFGGSPSPADPRRPTCTAPINPQERYKDDLFDDEQPIRGALEAAKKFVRRLDPKYDQIGYVSYSTTAAVESELQCLRRLGAGASECVDRLDEYHSSETIEETVIEDLDDTNAGGSTNIGDGIRRGIDVLSNKPGHYGRPGAAHIMIVMTDGEANQCPPRPGYGSGDDTGCNKGGNPCYAEDFYPNNTGNQTYDRAKDCTVYYAQQARNNGIVVYTITIGGTADIEIMETVAELTGGIHRHAPRPEQLDDIFDELYERIFLRLVQ
ncbi:MAG: VWA domain-containing protein [Anaerolineae bacterium]|nr:VWA domain-containing protein [Anaerolineae bacterium]